MKHFRLSQQVLARLKEEAERTGKSQTRVLEDAVMGERKGLTPDQHRRIDQIVNRAIPIAAAILATNPSDTWVKVNATAVKIVTELELRAIHIVVRAEMDAEKESRGTPGDEEPPGA